MTTFKIGQWVRVSRCGPCKHWGTGKIKAVLEGKLEIQPPGHGHTELVDQSDCKLWKSRNKELGK